MAEKYRWVLQPRRHLEKTSTQHSCPMSTRPFRICVSGDRPPKVAASGCAAFEIQAFSDIIADQIPCLRWVRDVGQDGRDPCLEICQNHYHLRAILRRRRSCDLSPDHICPDIQSGDRLRANAVHVHKRRFPDFPMDRSAVGDPADVRLALRRTDGSVLGRCFGRQDQPDTKADRPSFPESLPSRRHGGHRLARPADRRFRFDDQGLANSLLRAVCECRGGTLPDLQLPVP